MNKLNRVFTLLLTLEIVFGGGGRLLDPLGVPPLRYVFFGLAIVLFILNALTLTARANSKTLLTIFAIIALPVYGCLAGAINGNNISEMAFDFQPYIYMLILLYLCTLNESLTEFSLKIFIKVVKLFCIIASSIYILYIVLLKGGLLNSVAIYNALSLTSEFFFRPSGAFFAKSFFFLGIGAIFFFIEKRYLFFILTVVALFLTETRGVFLFSGIAMMIASFRINGAMKNLIYIALAVMAGLGLMVIVGGRAGDSDSVRLQDFTYIMNSMNGLISVFGHGFGAQILDRGRIEVVPLELFYKTGALGVILSVIPIFILSIGTILKSFTLRKLQIVCALIFSAGVSITNPFLYTPMGIFVMAMAINSNKNTSA